MNQKLDVSKHLISKGRSTKLYK